MDIAQGMEVIPPISYRNLCRPAIIPDTMPTKGPHIMPPAITPIIRVLAIAPYTSVPVYVLIIPNMAKIIDKINNLPQLTKLTEILQPEFREKYSADQHIHQLRDIYSEL